VQRFFCQLPCVLGPGHQCVPKCGSRKRACAPHFAEDCVRRALFPIAARHRDVRESLGAHPVSPLGFQGFSTIPQHRRCACARRRSPHPHLRRELGTAALRAWGTLEWIPAAPARDGVRRPDSPAGPGFSFGFQRILVLPRVRLKVLRFPTFSSGSCLAGRFKRHNSGTLVISWANRLYASYIAASIVYIL